MLFIPKSGMRGVNSESYQFWYEFHTFVLAVIYRLDHFIRLNAEAWADLKWWYQFIGPWNGVSLLSSLSAQTPAATIYLDASGSWGCGAICQGHWFQLQWDKCSEAYHISIKELLPIVIAAAIWGQDFVGKTILVRSDNVAAVAAINHQTSPVKEVAHLLRYLAFIMARFKVRLQAAHISGILNDIADTLSRNNMFAFFSLVSQADKHPLIIPSSLIHLLIPRLPDWTQLHWTELWSTIFQRDLPRLPAKSTRRESKDM